MNKSKEEHAIRIGVETIRQYAAKLPNSPGVYRMLGAQGDALYIGKAKALKKRVLSYTNTNKLPYRLLRMIALTRVMEFVHTQTEAEALLLESNLIKKHKPRFNVLLRDDKSFPYIYVSADHDFPLIRKHRGAKKQKGDYFGPFASALDVNHTINILQRVFLLRNCTDSYFAQRKRPCLQYHIKRCTAPCVGYVSKAEYGEQIDQARAFLEGRSRSVQEYFVRQMERASAAEEYEEAAFYRDRIRTLTSIQSRQDINVGVFKNADVIAAVQDRGATCVQIFFFRSGQNYGNRSYFPRHAEGEPVEEVLSAFIGQFYSNKMMPREIVISHAIAEKALIERALSELAQKQVRISVPERGQRRDVVKFVMRNAENALARHLSESENEARILRDVAETFDMDDAPQRIEIYDNSHISGTNMVGAMVVAGPEGLQKNAYRKFNIRGAGEGDDYAMMREMTRRRFARALKDESEEAAAQWPDLVLIDGGKGQFSAVMEVLEDLGIADRFAVVAIAKGEDRNAGRETFFMRGKKPFQLPERSPVLHYLQRLRDEAHRFAIGSHRSRRARQITSSPLDEIQGIGPARKKALLLHFGSAKAVSGAAVADLMKVEGISREVAQRIYDHFHE